MSQVPLESGEPVLLAYTGGADAAVALHFLSQRGHPVVTFTGDIGQGGDFDALRESAMHNGGVQPDAVMIKDLKLPFVTDFIWPAVRANARYQGTYLLGGALPKPLLGMTQAELARDREIRTLSHGATHGQNDRIRYGKAYRHILGDRHKVYVPWEDPAFNGQFPTREHLLAYIRQHGISSTTNISRPWTTETHLCHTSYEEIDLADFGSSRRPDMLEVTPQSAPDECDTVEVTFSRGTPAKVRHDGREVEDPVGIMALLNGLGGRHGVGIADIIETNLDGRKTRGVYVTPGGTILYAAHRDIEGATMQAGDIDERDALVPAFSTSIYAGDWFTPEFSDLRARMDRYQEPVCGTCRLTLYRGNVIVEGRAV